MSTSYPFKRLQTCARLAICTCHRGECVWQTRLVADEESRITHQDTRERSANQSHALPGWDELPPLPGFIPTCWLQHTTPPFAPFAAVRGRKSTAVLHNAVVGFRDSSSSPSRGRQVLAELPPRMHACYDYALNPPWIFPGSLHARRH